MRIRKPIKAKFIHTYKYEITITANVRTITSLEQPHWLIDSSQGLTMVQLHCGKIFTICTSIWTLSLTIFSMFTSLLPVRSLHEFISCLSLIDVAIAKIITPIDTYATKEKVQSSLLLFIIIIMATSRYVSTPQTISSIGCNGQVGHSVRFTAPKTENNNYSVIYSSHNIILPPNGHNFFKLSHKGNKFKSYVSHMVTYSGNFMKKLYYLIR